MITAMVPPETPGTESPSPIAIPLRNSNRDALSARIGELDFAGVSVMREQPINVAIAPSTKAQIELLLKWTQ